MFDLQNSANIPIPIPWELDTELRPGLVQVQHLDLGLEL